MGKITELSQGSLNGLRRQLNECIENAYNKGYTDGKKEVIELHGEQEYNRGIEAASYLLAYADERFIRECFPSESNWNLFDLNAKYGLAVLIKEFKKWQVEIDQTEEHRFIYGDLVKLDGKIGVIIRDQYSFGGTILTRAYFGNTINEPKVEDVKWLGKNIADKLQALFDDFQEKADE